LTLILRVEALLEAELLTLDITKTFSWREECIIHHLNITVMVKVRTEKRLKDGERYKERESESKRGEIWTGIARHGTWKILREKEKEKRRRV
jgi:hypothetical protein